MWACPCRSTRRRGRPSQSPRAAAGSSVPPTASSASLGLCPQEQRSLSSPLAEAGTPTTFAA
eukprot:1943179-Pleurochrysis_carterae.AAC.1